jgi:mannose-1-phosphate guanylyltransferase/phosphomannomutase
LLSQQIDHLKSYGITKVFICAGGFQSQIKEIFGDGSQMGVTIAFVSENKPMGTAGALKLAEGKLREEPFVVVHGDVLTDLNLREFIDFHLEEGSLATIGVKPRMGEKNYGQAFLHGNKIIRFLETGANQGISIVNTGLYVFSPEILERIPEGKKVKLESDIFPALAAERQLSAFIFQGNWNDVLTK